MAASRRTRTAQSTKSGDQVLAIVVDGRRYTLDPDELTGLDTAALRRETGMSIRAVMAALRTDPDIDLAAAIIWLSRRTHGEPDLAYAAVAGAVTYNTDIGALETAADDEADHPEQ